VELTNKRPGEYRGEVSYDETAKEMVIKMIANSTVGRSTHFTADLPGATGSFHNDADARASVVGRTLGGDGAGGPPKIRWITEDGKTIATGEVALTKTESYNRGYKTFQYAGVLEAKDVVYA
jgi:hypothetical protein